MTRKISAADRSAADARQQIAPLLALQVRVAEVGVVVSQVVVVRPLLQQLAPLSGGHWLLDPQIAAYCCCC